MSKRVVPQMPAAQKAAQKAKRRASTQARERLNVAADKQLKHLEGIAQQNRRDRKASQSTAPRSKKTLQDVMGSGESRWKGDTIESKVMAAASRMKRKMMGSNKGAVDEDQVNLKNRLQGRGDFKTGYAGVANRRMSAISKRVSEERQLQQDMGRRCCTIS